MKYFYGHKISQYGEENGYVDYGTLAKTCNHVLCNEIAERFDLELVGDYFDGEVYQWYIVDRVQELMMAGEAVFYCEELDCYVWGVTHFGTGWDYVLTNIKIDW